MTREEAIKILSERHSSALFSERTALKTLIPELRESEDERIRKEIISALKFANHDGVYDKHIAYLEKQKEQKPVEFDEYKIIKKHITEDILSSEVNKRLTECGWYVTDEKPVEWSEENEKDMAHIIRILDDCYAYGKHDLSKTDHENLVSKLKSLRLQPKEEQKPVDLEKEIDNKRRTMLLNLFGPMNGEQGLAIRNFARHFYELGLNARKEE